MRLIVSYTVGDDCTYSATIVEPMIYSSKENALLDFGSKIVELMDAKKNYMKKYNQWENRLNSISVTNVEKRGSVLKERPQEPSYDFNLGGCSFSLHDFVSQDWESKKEYISEPEFYTVDEWFKKVESLA